MDSHGHSHGHAHGHSHAAIGGWELLRTSTRLRIVMAALVVALAVAIAGLALLWPTGEGRQSAITAAESIGIATQRIDATIINSVTADCSYATPEDPQRCRLLDLAIEDGPDAGAQMALPEINLQIERGLPEFEPGDEVLLGYIPSTGTYYYEDQQRSGSLVLLAVIFTIVVLAFARIRGVLALASMAITIAVFVGFFAPSVLDGNDPILVALTAAAVIAFVSCFMTHGLSPTTAMALAGTLSALAFTFVLSWVFFALANFTGFGSSEALVLPFLSAEIQMSSLILGGAIIGALGALDDVTITQVATVAELRRQNPSLPSSQLVRSGMSIGRDHIAATVNTLLLAYAGASLPLLLLFAASEQTPGTVANSEVIAVEIVRTLCGSIGLIAAVPLTTTLAAAVLPPLDAAAVAVSPLEERSPRWSDFGPEADDES